MLRTLSLGMILIFLGIAVIVIGSLIGILVSIQRSISVPQNVTNVSEEKVEGGACIVIFFIPICFGTSASITLVSMVITAIALVIVALLIYIAIRWWLRPIVRESIFRERGESEAYSS